MKPAHPAIIRPFASALAGAAARGLAAALASALVLAALAPAAASAETVNAQVMADFNGYPEVGATGNQFSNAAGSGSGIDTGLVTTSGSDWLGGSGGPRVFPGTLTLDNSLPGYAITQQTGATDMVFRVFANRDSNAYIRQAYRDLVTPMTGAVWGSFLLRQSKIESEDNNGTSVYQMTGISFNTKSADIGAAANGNKRRIFAIGDMLTISSQSGTITAPPDFERSGVFTAGKTSLVLFRHDTASKQTDLWVDPPVLPADPALLFSASNAAFSGPLDLFGAGTLTTLGVGGNYYVDAVSGNGRSGDLDALRFDASAFGYYAVTGLPVPPDFTRPAPVIADFNDYLVGALNGTNNSNNQSIGFSEDKWNLGGGTLMVLGEDLSAPDSTGYAITQNAVTPRALWQNYASGPRHLARLLANPLSGQVWGSFLVRNLTETQIAGLTFNLNTATGDTAEATTAQGVRWLYAKGKSLLVRANTYNATPAATVPDVFTLGETALVLFNYDTIEKRLKVWVNPVLPDNVEGLPTATYDNGDTTPLDLFGPAGQIDRIGVVLASFATTSATANRFDALHLADGPTGYYSVTGLHAKPHISAQPQSATLLAGGGTTFAVTATSQWPLLYQWTHGGTAIDSAVITSATTSTLSISNVTDTDAGEYRVLVSHSGGIGATLSAAASLIIGTPEPLEILSGPVLTLASGSVFAPGSGTAGIDEAFSLAITATGNPPLSYQWLLNGTVIGTGTAATYAVTNAALTDAGAYSVHVADPVHTTGTTSGTVTLAVVGPPVIVTDPTGTSVFKNSPVSFTVGATCDTGAMAFQWFHDGAEISGALNTSATTATLSLSAVTEADAGGYWVKVSNADAPDLPAYAVTSATATLTVKLIDLVDAPVIADFNDHRVNAGLGHADNKARTGIGFDTTEGNWTSSSTIVQIVTGDLTAPLATGYKLTQNAASPRRVTALDNSTVDPHDYLRQNTRTLATPLSGQVWGSFLVQNNSADNITGLTFNYASNSTTPVERCRLAAEGTSLVAYGASAAARAAVDDVFTLHQTALVLFAYDTGTKRLRVWVDPELPDTAAGIETLEPKLDTTLDIMINVSPHNVPELVRIGVMARTVPGKTTVDPDANGFLDAIHLASGDTGYYRVTGLVAAPQILVQPQPRLVDAGDSAEFTVSATTAAGLGELGYQWYHRATAIVSDTAIVGASGSSFAIASAQRPADGGEYTVEVFHLAGAGMARSEPAGLFFREDLPELIITGSPAFTPSSTVVAGASVSMVVSASGTPLYTYQWWHGGTAIGDATPGTHTTGTHTIASAVIADAGDYSVVVNDLKGVPLTSGTITLTVVEMPEVLTPPSGTTVLKGEAAAFTVSATCGVSAMTYQWLHDGDEIIGATAATYSIPAVTEADAGAYTVRVSNAAHPAYSVTSTPAAVLKVTLADVLDAPVVADFNDCLAGQGMSNAANARTGIGFDTTEGNWTLGSNIVQITTGDLTAPPATGYGLTQNAASPRRVTALSSTDYLRLNTRTLATPLSGQVWGSFLVQNNQADNITGLTFNYASNSTTPSEYCRLAAEGTSLVAYGAGAATRVAVDGVFTLHQTALVLFSYDTGTKRLRVWVDPVLPDTVAGIETLEPKLDTALDIMTNTYSSTTHAVPELVRIGVMARTVAGKSSVDPDANGFLDALRLASGADGYYRVTGLSIPPVILEHPESRIVPAEGAPASFAVSATGVGALAYQWRHDGVEITDGAGVTGATAATLTFASTVRDDHGRYDVVVSHAAGAGFVVSKPAALIFDDERIPLEILSLQLLPSGTVHTGAAVSLIVSATGTEFDGSPITYQWLKDGADIPGATAATLDIDPVTTADTGGYAVRLDDAARIPLTSGTLALAVLGPPVILEQPAGRTVAGRTPVTLSVTATSVSPILYQWSRDGAEIPGATATDYAIAGAQPADAGDYSVRLVNADYPAQYVTFSATATLTVLATDKQEAPVVADFNDYLAGTLNSPSNDGKGIGFDPAEGGAVGGKWNSGSGVPTVAADDLAPPAWTNYGIRQPADTPRSVYGNYAAGWRAQYRTLATPLTGEVWGSFLVKNLNADQAAGLTFNLASALGDNAESTATQGIRWIYAKGADLAIRPDTYAADPILVPGLFTLGETALVLFNYDTAARRLRVWVNPVLTAAAAALPAPAYDSGGAPLDLLGATAALNQIGLAFCSRVANDAAASNRLDALRLSSGENGYYHVTGMSMPPLITAQPAARTIVDRGAPATLTVAATGIGPLLYQWTFWDAPILGATGASLVIPGVQAENQGKYRVIVRHDGGAAAVVSEEAVVLVREDLVKLAITRQPALAAFGDGIVPPYLPDGAPLALSVEAAGTPPLEYQWRKDGAAIAGATGAAFSIPAARVADSGDYDVEITDLAREKVTSLSVPLRVQVRPSILTPPQNAVSYEGGPVSFMVEALGTDLTYQWKRNGAPIAGGTGNDAGTGGTGNGSSGTGSGNGSGGTGAGGTGSGGTSNAATAGAGTTAGGAVLTLTNLTAADDGASYTVVVSNGVGSVESAAAVLTLKGATPPGAAGTVAPAADATVANGAQAGANLDGEGLAAAAFGTAVANNVTDDARKSYLSFDLPLAVESADATDATLALTLARVPFINGGTGATHPRNPVRLRLHGVINNAGAWAEDAITWATAPARASSVTAPGAGTVPLAETIVDVATRLAGDRVAFADPRIAQFLNWAAGRRGDLYGNGAAADTDHQVTFVITALDEGADFAGVRFADKEAGAMTAPKLAYSVGPDLASGREAAVASADEPGATQGRALQNDRYTVALAADLGVDVTDKTTGATAHFAAEFEVLYDATDPGLTTTIAIGDSAAPAITLPAWKTGIPELATLSGDRAHDYGAARGTRVPLLPARATVGDGQITWRFAPSDAAIAGFRAALELPAGDAAPRLHWTLAPAGERYFAVSFTGLPETPNEEIDAFYMPGVWDGRRFPSRQYVIDEVRATTPAVLRKIIGRPAVAGAAVDPFEIPVRISTRYNGRFGLYTTDFTATANHPAIAAPLYGGAGSRTDGTLSFAVRLVVRGGTLDAAIRDVVTGIYGFRDYRQNLAGGSLNTALDNMVDYLLDETVDPRDGLAKGYSYWRANEKANEYVNDNPDTVRFQSAATALGLALVRDDADYYEKRALPTIEYFVSRPKDAMAFTGTGAADETLGGPLASYYATDYFALGALTGGRTTAYAALADQSWMAATANDSTFEGKSLLEVIGAGATLTRVQTIGDAAHRGGWSFKLWHSLIAGYKATGKADYLADARVLADAYIKYRYTDGPASDFADVANSFWIQIGGRWESLLEMAELTGDATYADHAARAMDEFVRHIQFGPALNDFTVDGLSATTPAVKSALVSEVGLTSEASASSVSHRGIFMSAYAAPSLTRVAGLSGDPFYAAVGRSGIIGRWLNYPGYTIRNYYRADQLAADWPLRWYGIDPDYNGSAVTAHMNHPASLASIAIDFLMADAEYKSLGAVKFPYQFSDSKAYFRGRVFGGAPGVFYGETGVWPWLPRGLVTLSGENAVQLNYLAGHGNGRLYLAFSNQTTTEVTATVTVREDKARFTAGARMRLWRDNVQQSHGAFTNGATTVTVSPGGFTAIAIDDAAPVLGLQADYQGGNGGILPAASFSQKDYFDIIGRVTGMVLSLSPARQSAYVYVAAGSATLQSATLTYCIDGPLDGPAAQTQVKTLVKNEFPFEFSVPLPADAQYFTYSVSGVPAGGGGDVGGFPDTLYLVTPPVITSQPAGLSKTSGEAVLFTVKTDDPGGQYTYQWFKNGEPIPGATSSSYGFLCATTAVGGSTDSYHVVVTKGRIAIESNPATLVVAATPDVEITTPPAGTGAPLAEGTAYVLTAGAENADSYQWFWKPAGAAEAAPIPGAVFSTLTLAGAAYESGDYYVVAYGLVDGVRDSVTSKDTPAVVTFAAVPGAPAITAQPQGRAAAPGTAFALSVAATGAVSYQWYRDGAAVGENSPVLNLAGERTDNGAYHVVVTNGAGSTVSLRAVVTILPEPQGITAQPAGGLVPHGSAFTLTVTVAGDAEYQWRKDGVPIPGATSATLDLAGTPAEAGDYDVVVTTPAGRITSATATVTVTPDPGSHFAQSSAIAMDASGTLYIADAARHVIQAVAPDKNLTAFAGAPDSPGAVDGVGAAAKFNTPAGLVSRSGTLYVADAGNNSIRTVALSTRAVKTLLSGTIADATKRLSNPSALAVDAAGNVYVADTGNHVIRKVTATGTVTTLAGLAGVSGTTDAGGTRALFNEPAGLALLETGGGTLYIADTGNHTIRAIALDSGAVTTVAGRPAVAGSDDDLAAAALLNAPRGLVLDGPDLYFVDTGNSLIRKLAGGAVTTIAGYPGIGAMPGVPGFKDGAGAAAWFSHPEGITLGTDGTLYIADTGNKAIRAIDTSDNVVTLTVTATTAGGSQPPPAAAGSGGGGGGALSLWLLPLLPLLLALRRPRRK